MSDRLIEGKELKAIRQIEVSEPKTGRYHTQNTYGKELAWN
jgi:hypothetical protein